jgi:hypothetical protein
LGTNCSRSRHPLHPPNDPLENVNLAASDYRLAEIGVRPMAPQIASVDPAKEQGRSTGIMIDLSITLLPCQFVGPLLLQDQANSSSEFGASYSDQLPIFIA